MPTEILKLLKELVMNIEAILGLNVGDVIEVDGLFLGLSDEKLLLIATWIVARNAGGERTIEFSVKYFGVYLGKATCKVVKNEVTWVMGGVK